MRSQPWRVQTFYYVSCHRSVRRQRLRKDHSGPENNRSPGRSLGRPPVDGLVLQGLHVASCISVALRIEPKHLQIDDQGVGGSNSGCVPLSKRTNPIVLFNRAQQRLVWQQPPTVE